MRIGIDCRTILNPQAGERAGVAHYTHHLVKHLLAANRFDDFVLFFDHRAKAIASQFLEPNTVIRFFTFSEYKKYLPFVYSHILSASTISRERLDIFHSPANVVPLRYDGKFVVTLHDLAIYREPSFFPSRQGFSIKYLVPKSINSANKIIAVSESTKKDVIEFFKVPEKKVVRIYEGVDHERFRPRSAKVFDRRAMGIRDRFILFVGTLEPRKNLIRLIEAFYLLLRKAPELSKRYQLVIVGQKGWLYDSIFEEVKSRNLESYVLFPGYVSSADLPELYREADVFAYPSLYEGFGLPVLEAMASGTPVLTSTVSSLPELTGESAAVLVEPADTEGISNGLFRIISEPGLRESLKKRGLERANTFSWKRCAEETMTVYRQVVG